jgi:hypothetical protein
VSLVLVTAQGISNNYFKSWTQVSQSSNNETPRIIEIQDSSENGKDISPPDISKESEGTNQSTSVLPDVSSQGESEGTNQTGAGVQAGVLGGETGSESTNQTDGGVTDDQVSSENTNQTGETEDHTNNQNVSIQNNFQTKQRLDIIISEEEGELKLLLMRIFQLQYLIAQ